MVNRKKLGKQNKNTSFKKTKKRQSESCASAQAAKKVTSWCVNFSDKFGEWWDTLSEEEQIDVDAMVEVLEKKGPTLPYPYSSKINGSNYSHLRELRIQHAGRPYRVLYAFDPNRAAILLIGGDKTGDDRWYEKNIPVAEAQYDAHLRTLKKGR